jgi:hypothetical protein
MDLNFLSSQNSVALIPSWEGQGWVSPVSATHPARWAPLPGGND